MLHSLQSLMWSGHVADNSDTKPVLSKLLRYKKTLKMFEDAWSIKCLD